MMGYQSLGGARRSFENLNTGIDESALRIMVLLLPLILKATGKTSVVPSTADVPRGSQKTLMQKKLSTGVSLKHESYQQVWMWISVPEANSCGVLSRWRKPEGLPGPPPWVCLWQGELPLEAAGLQFQRLNLQEADSALMTASWKTGGPPCWAPPQIYPWSLHLHQNLTQLLMSGLEKHFSGMRCGKRGCLQSLQGSLSSKPTRHRLHQSQEQLRSTEDFTHTHTHTHAHTICFSGCAAAYTGFPDGSVVKNPPANAGDTGLIPGSGRVPGEGNGNPL